MSDTTTTPNMLLVLPTVSQRLGPQWAEDLNDAFSLIDEHDHTSGKGNLVPTAGLNINADLSLNSNDLKDIRSLKLNNSVSTLPSDDVRSLYASGGNLYYNNNSGTAIQLTTGASINTGALAVNVWSTQELAGNLTIAGGDSFVFIDVDTSAPRSITLPAASAVTAGRYYVIKDKTSTAATNNITIYPDGSDTIDTAASTLILSTNNASLILISDGVDSWLTVGSTSGFVRLGGDLLGTGSTVNTPRVSTLTGLSGLVTMTNNTALNSRNAANSVNVNLIKIDGSDDVLVGDSSFDMTLLANELTIPNSVSGSTPTISATTIQLLGSTSVDLDGTDITIDATTGDVALSSASGDITLNSTNATVDATDITITATDELKLVSNNVIEFVGALLGPTKSINSAYTVDTTTADETIFVDTAGGAVTITMPTPTAGRRLTIKDKNSASTNNITLDIGMTGQIEGVGGSYTIDKATAGVTFVADGADWWNTTRRGLGASTLQYVQQRIPIGLDPDQVAGTWSTSAGLQSMSSLLTSGSRRDVYILNPPNTATLESITMRYNPGGTARAPATRLGIYVERLSTSDAMTTGNGDSLISGASFATTTSAQVPVYASYAYQTYEFVCDQNNVIDSNQYTYVIRVESESGAGATNTNSVSGFTFKYSVPDSE